MTLGKRTIALLSALWIAAGICAIGTVRSFRRDIGMPAQAGAKSAYILRANGDYVAVYEAGTPGVPIEITDIAVSELREHDQALLRAGLGAEDREALLMLLEDLKA